MQGLTAGLIVLAYVLVYHQIEDYWLSPRLSAKTMLLNGGVSFGAALAGGGAAEDGNSAPGRTTTGWVPPISPLIASHAESGRRVATESINWRSGTAPRTASGRSHALPAFDVS